MGRHTRRSTGYDYTNDTAANTRRSHTKSRNGCAECKRRHIRCDERRPSCANCQIAERACFFPPPKVCKRKQGKEQQHHAYQHQGPEATDALTPTPEASPRNNDADSIDTAHADHAQIPLPPPALGGQGNLSYLAQAPNQPHHGFSLRPDAALSITGSNLDLNQAPSPASPMQLNDLQLPPADSHPGFPSQPSPLPEAIFTPQHLILLHHAGTVPNFTGPNRSAVEIAIRRAIDSPYLIDEILAFTAFHIAHQYPGSAVPLGKVATELQTRALTTFTRLTETVPKDDKATAVPRFLFSAILGRHVLADTLTHYRSDFHSFIDHLVGCFNLNRGITSVTPPAQYYLSESELQPFLNVVLEAQKKTALKGDECDPLRRLLVDADLSEGSTKACRHAIETLQWSFDICRALEEEEYPQAVSVFSVKVEASFVEMLRKYRPEALVILAYYGVLLHRCRSFWAFSSGGASMIRAIAGHLGGYWQEPLAWPLHVLERERNLESVVQTSTLDVPTILQNASAS